MVYLEPALAPSPEVRSHWLSRPVPIRWLLFLLALATVVTRAAPFGDAVAHVDDEFYLLVGQVVVEGGWPYVDIWDRKPIGLFLIYAAVAWVAGPWAVEGIHLLAGLFAFGTALIVALIGRRMSNDVGGLFAGFAYLVCITLFGGETGQSPVFYNLLMAGAALLLVHAVEIGTVERTTRNAFLAMGLCGLAMTIKQISFIEGAFFGLVFLWQFHKFGLSLAAIAARAAGMVLIALLPTALALGIYVAAGHGQEFIFANFVSIFLKNAVGGPSLEFGLTKLGQFMPPILLLALVGAWYRYRRGSGALDLFMLGWIVAAIAGYLFVPYFFDHYALPLMVPLAISAATILALPVGGLFLILLAHLSISQASMLSFGNHDRRAEAAAQISDVIRRELRGGCLYLVSGRTHFFRSTQACRLSRFVFPDHLNDSAEVDGIGVDQLAEVRRIFALKPAVVMTDPRNEWRRSPATKAFIDAELARHYRMIYQLPGTKPRNLVSLRIWSRKDR
jgi:hypothetical protein